MVESLRFGRMRLTTKEACLRRADSKPAGKPAKVTEGPAESDLTNAADGIGQLKFSVSIFEDPQKAQDVHQQKSSNPEDPFPYLSAEERALMDFFVPLPAGITQRRKDMLLKSIQRKLEEAQIEREEDEASAQRRIPFGKSDPQAVAMRLERRQHYQALEDQFKKDEEERKRRERTVVAPQIKQKELKPKKKKAHSKNGAVAHNKHSKKSHTLKPHRSKRLTAEELEKVLAFIESSNEAQKGKVA